MAKLTDTSKGKSKQELAIAHSLEHTNLINQKCDEKLAKKIAKLNLQIKAENEYFETLYNQVITNYIFTRRCYEGKTAERIYK